MQQLVLEQRGRVRVSVHRLKEIEEEIFSAWMGDISQVFVSCSSCPELGAACGFLVVSVEALGCSLCQACDTLGSSFPAKCLENSYPGAAAFHFTACLSLCQSPFQPRGFEHWSRGKRSFGLGKACEPGSTSGWKPISFRISSSQSLGLCKQLPESRKFVTPHWASGTEQKTGTSLCCKWRGSTSVKGTVPRVQFRWVGSVLSPLQEAEVAISARQFATSLVVSVQLYCEMSLAAQLFLWRVIF